MDKADFVEKAPHYYALAIALTVDTKKPKSVWDIEGDFSSGIPTSNHLAHWPLINQAIKILEDADVIELEPDDFGPTIYRAKPNIKEWLQGDAAQKFPVFQKYIKIQQRSWVGRALQSVNSKFSELKISAEDFAPENLEVEWEPIPLDRMDEKLQAATAAVDAAIEQIEGDNGYAAHVPGEREYVLSNLKTFSAYLKEQTTIYTAQIKTFAIDPLNRVIKRFGPASLGVVASAARQALFEWLKANFAKALHWIM